MDWFRSHHGAPSDPKWLVVARKAKVAPALVISTFWMLLDYASQHQDRGSVQGFDIEVAAAFMGVEDAEVQSILTALTERGVIVDGKLCNWDKRQPKREDDSRERVQRYRNAKKLEETPLSDTVTHCNASVTQRNDREKEREREREILPLTPTGGMEGDEFADDYEDTLGDTLSEPLPAPARRQPSKAAIHDQKCQDLLAAFRHTRHDRPLSETVPYTFRREGMQLAAAMVKDGITPEQIINATKTALANYARPDMVTFQAVGRNIETLLGQSSRPVPSQEARSYQMPKRGYTGEEMAAMFPEIAALDAWVAESMAGRTTH